MPSASKPLEPTATGCFTGESDGLAGLGGGPLRHGALVIKLYSAIWWSRLSAGAAGSGGCAAVKRTVVLAVESRAL